MFTMLGLAFVYVLLLGVTETQVPTPRPSVSSQLYSVAPGQSQLIRIDGELAWVSHIDPERLSELQSVSGLVEKGGCAERVGYCVLSANTKMDGVLLAWSENPPLDLTSHQEWFGGLVDPTNGQAYDQLGRPYSKETSTKALKVISQMPLEKNSK